MLSPGDSVFSWIVLCWAHIHICTCTAYVVCFIIKHLHFCNTEKTQIPGREAFSHRPSTCTGNEETSQKFLQFVSVYLQQNTPH